MTNGQRIALDTFLSDYDINLSFTEIIQILKTFTIIDKVTIFDVFCDTISSHDLATLIIELSNDIDGVFENG